jgi:hypothetical protein
MYLELQISPRIFEKIRNDPNGILRGLGETDSRKNLKSNISWHCPFKKLTNETTNDERTSDTENGMTGAKFLLTCGRILQLVHCILLCVECAG